MLAKSTLVFALFSFAAQLVAATPNACLLMAVNGQPNPVDMGAVCGDGSSQVQKAITDLCGSDAQGVLSTYSSTCQGAGKTVVINQVNSTSSSSSSSSGSSSASSTTSSGSSSTSFASSTGFLSSTTAKVTGTATTGSALTASGTATSTSTATGAASVNMANSMGAVAVFAAGLIIVL